MGGDRSSNIELLRILAMFLVLVVHADFFSLGMPTHQETVNEILPSFSRFFFQSLSIICVDVFVLISGWFGIKPRLQNVSNFIFQCLFFLTGIYVVMLLGGLTGLSLKGVLGCLGFNSYWFVKAYLGLMILAPLCNSYIEKSSERQLRKMLIAFFVLQTIYGWSGAAEFFMDGYSTMSFIGLYLLARYVRLFPHRLTSLSKSTDLLVFCFIVFAETVTGFMVNYLGYPYSGYFYSYISPLVVLSSLYLLLFFSKLEFQSKFINWVAGSCFAVYLLHTNSELFC